MESAINNKSWNNFMNLFNDSPIISKNDISSSIKHLFFNFLDKKFDNL